MTRLDRLSAILILLQSRKRLRAQDIADRFEVTLRTVYRDIRTLEMGGVPVIGEAGKGYALAEGYKLPPVMFTREEVTALLTAEKMLGKFAGEGSGRNYGSAMDKIRSVLKSPDREFLESMESSIAVVKSRPQRHNPQAIDPLQTIIEAIAGNTVLSLKYLPAYAESTSSRDIEPVGVFYLDNFWHLIAWCRLRQDYRDFRFDRMHDLRPKDENFTANHPPLGQFISKIYPDIPLQQITIEVSLSAHRYLGEQKYYQGLVEEVYAGDHVEMKFLSPGLPGFCYWFLTFADMARVISPPELKELLLERVRKMEENLSIQ